MLFTESFDRCPTSNHESCEIGALSYLTVPRRTHARGVEICAQVDPPKASSDLGSLSSGALSARVDSRGVGVLQRGSKLLARQDNTQPCAVCLRMRVAATALEISEQVRGLTLPQAGLAIRNAVTF